VKERTLDNLDIMILRELAENCRNPINNIAKKLRQPKSTIHYRLRKLEEQGIIRGCVLQVDEQALGWNFSLMTLVYAKYERGSLQELGKRLADLPEAWAVYSLLGDADFLVLSKHRSPQEVSDFLEKLASLEGVERVSSILILESVKEDPASVVKRLSPEN